MLHNRIVRAVVGVVFAKAAVAAGWYLYLKSQKEENDWSKGDSSAQDTSHNPSKGAQEVQDYQNGKIALSSVTVTTKKPAVKKAAKPEGSKPRKSRAKTTKEVNVAPVETVSEEVKVPAKRARKTAAKKTPTA